ncbi:ABC transporter permease [Cellvibrio japonicus]|uniref:Permease protein of sugar ABC transporter n=1 Tax=Cellvibrio japonicus (strain Ueda107) TaxID=498211 RepID=B3PJ33_CELJU|nr:ABC transporter permease [Cellvibrio japonicus]ACE83745.1 permease protein of sugar ABC transporter [Cellvibrio japonicus Ueda107]QEI11234.1 ABC transporter permease [Cellvibrio japonicus]QEI14808.1 ABC transporter permease [Cellvibrio japonicus]QEI18388.1 ABC transporter permease [Cellvibrio japonicus]
MRIEKRLQDSPLMLYLSPLLALLLTLISGALLFALLGRPPLGSLYTFFIAPISDGYGLSELAVKVTPLLLCALGLTLCFKAKIWNIGAEGQFVFGALIGGAVSLQFAEQQGWWVLPAIIASGALAGLVWAGIAALLLTRFNANEILTTIMLNYIAVNLLLWAVHGPLKDPDGFNFPESALFAPHTLLPVLFEDYRVSIALFIALFMLVVIWVVLSRTLLGFQLRVMGENHQAARFAGFNGKALTWLLLLFSGAMAGVAAISETNGPVGQLIPTLSLGYGYAAIIVVFMGRMHPLGILLSSGLLGLTYLGGEMAQIDQGLPKSITGLFQGMLLFYLLACDLLISYRLVLNTRTPGAVTTTPASE